MYGEAVNQISVLWVGPNYGSSARLFLMSVRKKRDSSQSICPPMKIYVIDQWWKSGRGEIWRQNVRNCEEYVSVLSAWHKALGAMCLDLFLFRIFECFVFEGLFVSQFSHTRYNRASRWSDWCRCILFGRRGVQFSSGRPTGLAFVVIVSLFPHADVGIVA